jgi:4,5-DOPA dioxygenase extradiol
MTTAPVIFVSHGAPTFAMEPGLLGGELRAIGKKLSGLKAVLIISPHWQTDIACVMTTEKPATIHDFGGFPSALYRLQYAATGDPERAANAGRLLAERGFLNRRDDKRGLDHGAWVPMLYLLPDADVPVFQVSMPYDLNAATAIEFGRALAPLRESGVMILCSGGITHNLYEFRPGAAPVDYVTAFTTWIRDAVVRHDIAELVNYRQLAPHAERAHPTEEHFLPLLIAMGACDELEAAQVIDGGVTDGVISMESYAWGLP